GLEVPESDLLTLSYVLGELPPGSRDAVVAGLAGRTRMLAIVEPGTPDGYARVLRARDQLLALGLRVAAPCPHGGACPVTGDDWCHFAVRLQRTGLHRRLKTGELGFEDEKFSYVVATTEPVQAPGARVLRHPRTRKGLVTLTLCGQDGIAEQNVSKKHGDRYRAARDVDWGDAWD
ncbi:MAG: rRNA methyltransferase, partial [Nonomuraea sp.]|nr:rRNA methyltransferase [Nonomuraea sp.]